MLFQSVKNNLRAVFRDPTTLIALLIAVIMQYMHGFRYEYMNQYDVDTSAFATRMFDYAMNVMMNSIAKPVYQIAFPFLGIVIAINLFKEKRTQVWDITMSSRLSFGTFYLGKVISYYLIGLVMCVVLGLSFEISFAMTHEISAWDVNWKQILLGQIVWMLTIYTSCLPIPIAVGVFAASLFGVSAASAVANLSYYYFPQIIWVYKQTAFARYVHVIPQKFWIFLKYWVIHPQDWYEITIGDPEWFGYSSSLVETLISYAALIGISIALLTAAYFLLKRRFLKA